LRTPGCCALDVVTLMQASRATSTRTRQAMPPIPSCSVSLHRRASDESRRRYRLLSYFWCRLQVEGEPGLPTMLGTVSVTLIEDAAVRPNYWSSTLIVGKWQNIIFYAKNRKCPPLQPNSRSFVLFDDLCSSNRCFMARTDPANGWKHGCFTPWPSLGVKFEKQRPGEVAPCH
jgi:hypothetical protein